MPEKPDVVVTPPPAGEVFTQEPVVRPTPGKRSFLWRLVDYILLLCVAGLMVTVTLQVISRLMGQSLPWTEETTRYLFIWTAFLGLAAGFRSAEHARIGIVINLLPPVLKRLCLHLYVVAGLVFFSVVGYKGFQLVMRQFHNGETSPALGIGMYLVTLPVVLSAVLAILAHFESVYRDPALREQIEKGGLLE